MLTTIEELSTKFTVSRNKASAAGSCSGVVAYDLILGAIKFAINHPFSTSQFVLNHTLLTVHEASHNEKTASNEWLIYQRAIMELRSLGAQIVPVESF